MIDINVDEVGHLDYLVVGFPAGHSTNLREGRRWAK